MPGVERAYTEPFSVGRGMHATLHVDSGRVSRLHAEVAFEDGQWVLRDAGSTNGTYHDGRRVERLPLVGETAVRLGQDGPFVYLSVGPAPSPGAGRKPEGGPAKPTSASTSGRSGAEQPTQPHPVYRPPAADERTAWYPAAERPENGSRVAEPTEEPGGRAARWGVAAVLFLVVLSVILVVLIL